MAAPLAALLPAIGKSVPYAIGAAKGLLGMAAKGGASKLAGASAGQAARRFAGSKLASLGSKLGQGAKKVKGFSSTEKANLKYLKDKYGIDLDKTTREMMNPGLNMSDDAGLLDRIRRSGTLEGFKKNVGGFGPGDLATQFGYDALSGLMVGATTEGDLVDKAIAGSGVALGGGLGGLTARGVLGPKSTGGIIAAEFGGMMLGDAVGYGMADNLIRAKNGGMTPAEQRYSQQDEEYRSQLLQELKQQYGLG